MHRAVRAVVVVLTVTACGGGDPSSDAGARTAVPDAGAESGPTTDQESGVDDVVVSDLDEIVVSETVSVAADRLVAVLGDDAGVAVLLALDRGYDAFQIEGAAGADALGADGVIDGERPVHAPTHGFAAEYEDEYALTSPPDIDGRERAQPMLLRHPADHGDPDIWVRVGTPRDLLEVAAERAQNMGRSDDAAGVVALILVLAEAGYDLEQITEALLEPEILGLAHVDTDWEDLDGNSRFAECTMLVDVATREPVIPRRRPVTSECAEVVDRVGIEEELHVRAELTEGPVIGAPQVQAVTENAFRIEVKPELGQVGGQGVVTREVILNPDADCVDHKMSGLRVYFAGEVVDRDEVGVLTIEGTFLYNVAADRFRLLGDACEGANLRFGSGRGTWSGTFDTRALTAHTEFEFPGGLGTNVIETPRD